MTILLFQFVVCDYQTKLYSSKYWIRFLFNQEKSNARAYFFAALHMLMRDHKITEADRVAYLSGSYGEGGGTTFLELNRVGDILNSAKDYLLPTFTAR